MHPDNLLAGLRRELDRFPDRKKEIEAEIARVEALPRPTVAIDEPERTVDTSADYLQALEKERSRSSEDRHAAIDEEIARVKAALRSARVGHAVSQPAVEQAVEEPARRGGRPRKTDSDSEE